LRPRSFCIKVSLCNRGSQRSDVLSTSREAFGCWGIPQIPDPQGTLLTCDHLEIPPALSSIQNLRSPRRACLALRESVKSTRSRRACVSVRKSPWRDDFVLRSTRRARSAVHFGGPGEGHSGPRKAGQPAVAANRKRGRKAVSSPEKPHRKLEARFWPCTVCEKVRRIPRFRKTASPAERPRGKAGGATAQDCRWSTIITAFYSESAPLMPQRSAEARKRGSTKPNTVCTENRRSWPEWPRRGAIRGAPFLWWAALSTLP
jgi:hypothetical protein